MRVKQIPRAYLGIGCQPFADESLSTSLWREAENVLYTILCYRVSRQKHGRRKRRLDMNSGALSFVLASTAGLDIILASFSLARLFFGRLFSATSCLRNVADSQAFQGFFLMFYSPSR